MKNIKSPVARAEEFAARLGIRLPILLAPMAGACPTVIVGRDGECGRDGRLRRAADEAGRDRDMVRRFSRAEQGRVSNQSLDSRAGAEARCGTGAAPARIPGAVGTRGSGERG